MFTVVNYKSTNKFENIQYLNIFLHNITKLLVYTNHIKIWLPMFYIIKLRIDKYMLEMNKKYCFYDLQK